MKYLWILLICLAALPIWSAQAHAQSDIEANGRKPKSAFELSAERRHINDDASGPQQSLRIQRRQLNGNACDEPKPDQTYRTTAAARKDANSFGLHADDWTTQTPAPSQTPMTMTTVRTVKELANFDLELIVDESLSMRHRDCPGGTSRWEWCGIQLGNLSNQLSSYAPRGFTLTTFASQFESYPNATSGDVQQLFANPQLGSGTRLSRPLEARLGHYFANRSEHSKPLLIVVITDGVPSPAIEPLLVTRTLIAATHRVVKPNEVTVVFFQVGGGDFMGRIFLNQLDNSLVSAGAKFDIVRTVPFEQLQQQGLTASLVGALRNFGRQATR